MNKIDYFRIDLINKLNEQNNIMYVEGSLFDLINVLSSSCLFSNTNGITINQKNY